MKNTEMTGWKQRTAQRLSETYPTDERTQRVNEKGLAACGAVAYLYVAARIIYVGIRGSIAVPELVLLFLMMLVLFGVNRQNDVHELPLVLWRRLDPAPAAKGGRIARYALNALVYAGLFAIADLIFGINPVEQTAVQIAMDFAIGLAVWFLVDLIYYEHKIKQYNSYIAGLEAEENDLS